jgi:hypothetical protein
MVGEQSRRTKTIATSRSDDNQNESEKKYQRRLHAIQVTNDPRETGGYATRYRYTPTQGQPRKNHF